MNDEQLKQLQKSMGAAFYADVVTMEDQIGLLQRERDHWRRRALYAERYISALTHEIQLATPGGALDEDDDSSEQSLREDVGDDSLGCANFVGDGSKYSDE